MTQLHDDRSAASWAMPIAVGSILAFAIPLAMELGLGPACCCAPLIAPVLGSLTAWLALHRDPRLTAGQGFAVSTIAVGLGSVAFAAVSVARQLSIAPEERERWLREAVEKAGRSPDLTPEELDELIGFMVEAMPYAPIVAALVMTVLAGLAGLVTVALLRGRSAPAAP